MPSGWGLASDLQTGRALRDLRTNRNAFRIVSITSRRLVVEEVGAGVAALGGAIEGVEDEILRVEREASAAFGTRDHLVVDRRGRGRDEVVVGKPALAQNGGQRLLPEIAFKWIVWVWHGDEVFDKCVLFAMKVITPLLATQAPGNRSVAGERRQTLFDRI